MRGKFSSDLIFRYSRWGCVVREDSARHRPLYNDVDSGGFTVELGAHGPSILIVPVASARNWVRGLGRFARLHLLHSSSSDLCKWAYVITLGFAIRARPVKRWNCSVILSRHLPFVFHGPAWLSKARFLLNRGFATGVIVSCVSKKIHSQIVLDEVSIKVPAGRVIGLEGINGSGKTMLMRSIAGLVHVDSGEIVVDGVHIGMQADTPKSIGLLIENPAFLDGYSGMSNLVLLARLSGRASCEDIRCAMERVGLDPDDGKPYKGYSLGMKQRLALAAAVMEHPDLLLLDEPTNALDCDGIRMAVRLVREERARGAAILVACHDRQTMRGLADGIYHLSDGRIIGFEEVDHESE